MRSALLQYFPAAVEAFEDLAAPDALSVLRRAPNPDLAAKLTRVQLVAAPRSARRHHVEAKAGVLLKVLRAPALRQPATLQGAYPSVVLGQVTIIAALQQPDRWTSRGHERTTRGKARSLALRGRRVSCWPATPPTDVSAPRCICKPSPRSGHRRKPAPTTMRCDDETSATTPPFANSPTDSLGSFTAASNQSPSMTRTLLGNNTKFPPKPPPLDKFRHGMSVNLVGSVCCWN